MSQEFGGEELRAAYAPMLRDTTTAHRPGCPSAEALQAAAAGRGAGGERLAVLDRALACPACRRELALLHALASAEARERQAMVRRSVWTRLVPLAAAASLVLAVGIAGVNRWRLQGETGPGEDVLRAGLTSAVPALLVPENGATVAGGPVRFAWKRVAGAMGYTLELDATDGTVLLSTSLTDTSYTASLARLPLGEHRWLVRARMDDGTERRSETRTLRLH